MKATACLDNIHIGHICVYCLYSFYNFKTALAPKMSDVIVEVMKWCWDYGNIKNNTGTGKKYRNKYRQVIGK